MKHPGCSFIFSKGVGPVYGLIGHLSFGISHFSLRIKPNQVLPSRANSGEVGIHPMIVCLATDNGLTMKEFYRELPGMLD
jgi:hypothetical protein